MNEKDFIVFLERELGIIKGEITTLDIEFRSFRLWSSLNALFLITRIGEETGIIITSSQIAQCETFRDILKLID